MVRPIQSLPAKVSQAEAVLLYDRLAPVYDAWSFLTETRARDRALELADIHPGQHILEAAAGTGVALEKMVRKNPGGRNVGIDTSPGMLAKAERRLHKAGLSNYELRTESVLSIREPDACFDRVFCNYLFDLLDQASWKDALAEFHRVLKPGGRLVLVNMTFGERWGSGIYQRIYRLSPSLMGGCRAVHLSEHLTQSGFQVRGREYCQQLLFPSEIIVANKTPEH